MCGRFVLTQSSEAIADTFKVEVPDFLPRYNIAPSSAIAAILEIDEVGKREFVYLRWGLIPSWAKDPAISYKLINARSETVSEKPSFRYAFKHRRCVILADGFYEWQRTEGSKAKKQPYYFTLKDSQFMAFAGLWERWESSEGDLINSCTILTVGANELLQPIHDRMPVILPPPDWDTWLDKSITRGDRLQPLLKPLASELMESHAVGTKVNSPKNNTPECLQPLLI